MPITALPQDTARAIGSTSVISDPCSVVKELLDNALDASATSVFIEISQNTVDVIQVKDNGCGIPPSDHALVCKRAHTSKIATVEDLKKIGGSSLGFRGEALASTAEVSGGVTVTTRVDTEPVASVIRYGRDGGVISVQRASHPVGTTVRVTDLFKHIPVRRQTTLKNTTKTLARVKRLIQEYAAAQPSKRLSLKVLKAKNENGNWMYAPKPNAGLLDAALKIAGTDVASTCVLKHWPIPEATSDFTCVEGNPDCRMTALVLDPNAASRGIGKNIAKIYKSYVRSGSAARESTTTVTDPFLCLHVYCNEATYDVNIEPAKDDVLFENTPSILEAIEELCRDVYGAKEGDSEKRSTSVKGKEPVRQRDGFELLLASSQSTSQGQQRSVNADEAGNRHPTPVTQTTPQPSRGRVQGLSDERRRDSDIRAYSANRESLNPWTITKIITPVNRPGPASTDTSARRLSVDRTWPSPGQHRNSESASRRSSVASCLPSPSASDSSPTSNSPPGLSSSGTPFPISQTSPSLRTNYAKRAARERDRERYGNGSLDTWFGKTTQVGLSRIAAEDPSSPEEQESLTQLAQERFGSETQPSPSQSRPAGCTSFPNRLPHPAWQKLLILRTASGKLSRRDGNKLGDVKNNPPLLVLLILTDILPRGLHYLRIDLREDNQEPP
ncbi:predicted protein [Aspergillus terreus NIH2624]|uniref:DNA mismatch repair protein S5 domain-containing protein n=1 Tax=Aspergillus terreus (strain NIH 2624 / FGSC A1156) TaxID=341663 RepID=Q0CEW5_ASPTN|nr:uncharacterized protein ATEG_07769 [Aspergillus terreus NIH2624]EAU32031.1 predicted protein [Aspergillus terreus NIH2624]